MKQVVLTDRTGHGEIVEECRVQWLEDLLLYIGVDAEGLKSLPSDYVRRFYLDNDIEIIYYQDIKACKVLYKDDIIGEWLGPSFKLKKDQGFYFEITLESWSIAEELNENEKE